MPKLITEDMIEEAAIRLFLFVHAPHYRHIDCHTRDPENLDDGSGRADKGQVTLPGVLLEKLRELNPEIPDETIERAARELCRSSHGGRPDDNRANYEKLRNGLTVQYDLEGRKTPGTLRIIDFDRPGRNSFIVVSQMWIKGRQWRRPDLIIFVNGLPLVFIELKNADISLRNAYDKNLSDYRRDIPRLFDFNQICVLSNGVETRLGSSLAGFEHFFEWLKEADESENPDREAIRRDCTSLEYFIRGLCGPAALLDYIENFIVFDRTGDSVDKKIIAKNHQYFGVNNAFRAFIDPGRQAGKLGVFWHTQGSGKSYSMLMLAQKILRKLKGNFTFLIVTDRVDLDDQIHTTFVRCGFLGKEERCRPNSGRELREALKTNKRILFTLIQKFQADKGEPYPLLSNRDDIVVFVDEAHRTQYKELAENMRKGLPRAQYLAFTGTPLLGPDRKTHQWFGDYVSEYNFAQSIKDRATVPLYYVKRVPEVELRNDFFEEDFIEILENENLTEAEQRKLETRYAKVMEVLKRDDRLDAVARHIAGHFPHRGFLGKGMVISVDKFTALSMHDKVKHHWDAEIKRLFSEIVKADDQDERKRLKGVIDWMRQAEMAVVISEEADENEKFARSGLSIEQHRRRMNASDENGATIEDNFKNPDHPLSLVFVCSMWLTGFDAPSVSTLYLDKPMKGHSLMQAIARANRVFPRKANGLVVDHLDVFKHLNRALAEYASDDSGDAPVKDIEKLFGNLKGAIDLALAFCAARGMDLKAAAADTFAALESLWGFADVIVGNDDTRGEFRVLANTVENLYESLRPDIFQMDFDQKYMRAILYLQGIIENRIRPNALENAKRGIDSLLDQSVVTAEGAMEYTINGPAREMDISAWNTDALRARLKQARHRNLEIADLRRHIEVKMERLLRKNATRISFAERYRAIIDAYNAGGSQNEDFYEKLIKFMEEMQTEEERHIKEGLSEEELELYDILRKDKLSAQEEQRVKLAAKDLYATLTAKKSELFLVGWHNDEQTLFSVKREIIYCLNKCLPICYDKPTFDQKTDAVLERLTELAGMGGTWVAVA